MLPTFLIVFAYLLGSVCSAIIVCRVFGLPDPRTEGSKNPGATNVLRLAGNQYAAIVLLGDMLKGTVPVLLASVFNQSFAVIGFTALAAVIGHMYPVFFGFKGGKGVATALGAYFGIQIILGTLVSATWLLVARFSHYSSLASILSVVLAPFFAVIILKDASISPPLFIITLLVLYQHRTNFARLVDGTEPKVSIKPHMLQEIMKSKDKPAREKSRKPSDDLKKD